jgi:hypothetical protein
MAEVPQRLTGEAAWRAAKERIAKNNAATHARAHEARVARDAEAVAQRVADERQDRKNRPVQPGR